MNAKMASGGGAMSELLSVKEFAFEYAKEALAKDIAVACHPY